MAHFTRRFHLASVPTDTNLPAVSGFVLVHLSGSLRVVSV
jgi:hypothetical protein